MIFYAFTKLTFILQLIVTKWRFASALSIWDFIIKCYLYVLCKHVLVYYNCIFFYSLFFVSVSRWNPSQLNVVIIIHILHAWYTLLKHYAYHVQVVVIFCKSLHFLYTGFRFKCHAVHMYRMYFLSHTIFMYIRSEKKIFQTYMLIMLEIMTQCFIDKNLTTM